MAGPAFLLILDDEWSRWERYYQALARRLCELLKIDPTHWAGDSDPQRAYANILPGLAAGALRADSVLVVSDVVGTDWRGLARLFLTEQGVGPRLVFFSRERPDALPKGAVWVSEKLMNDELDAATLHAAILSPDKASAVGVQEWTELLAEYQAKQKVSRASVLKHRLVHLFLPVSVLLQTARELAHGEGGDRAEAQRLAGEAGASFPDRLREAGALVDEYERAAQGDGAPPDAAGALGRLRDALAGPGALEAEAFHAWMGRLDDALNDLRQGVG